MGYWLVTQQLTLSQLPAIPRAPPAPAHAEPAARRAAVPDLPASTAPAPGGIPLAPQLVGRAARTPRHEAGEPGPACPSARRTLRFGVRPAGSPPTLVSWSRSLPADSTPARQK